MQYSHCQITETLPFSNYWDYSHPKLTLETTPFQSLPTLWQAYKDTQTTDYSKITPQILPDYSKTLEPNMLCLDKGSFALKRRAGSGRQYIICSQKPRPHSWSLYIIWLYQLLSQTTLSIVNLLLNEPGTPPNSSHPLLGGVGVWDYYLLQDFSQINPFLWLLPNYSNWQITQTTPMLWHYSQTTPLHRLFWEYSQCNPNT